MNKIDRFWSHEAQNIRCVRESDYDALSAELAELKAGQGEAVAWREHSEGIAKGEKCPATIETLQAAWDRDQELLLDQKSEISKLKETINQLRQKRSAPTATAAAVSVPVAMPERWEDRLSRMHQTIQAGCWPKRWVDDAKDYELGELRALIARQEVKS